ncbi:MAG: nicotinate phosphoribosyltransferase [Desulforegulaceae bacterium]|nr:nicotinate phosphoribosyltransferase [Desulforegulaceae bacterium]
MILKNSISPLFTDFYELTMMAGYFKNKMNKEAVFSVSLRLDEKRNFFVFSGLETVLNWILNLKFSEEEIDFLKSMEMFEDDFLDWLKNYKFTGEIISMDEGEIFFGNEPVMEITAPIMEAQLLETMVVNAINFESMIATKAARCIFSSKNIPISDFASRRTQGIDAGIKTARSSYLAGFTGTSNVLASKLYSIPVTGTMAHSFVTAFENEKDSFYAFSKTFPDHSVLLIDSYDTIKGAKTAVKIAKIMESEGKKLVGVRLDSGDMAKLSKEVRKILDKNNLSYVKIFASGGFDEYKIKKTIESKAQIDAFGVGTSMGVSSDSPYHNTVFKLCRFDGRNVKKLSKNKQTLAGTKQVYRFFDENLFMTKDIIGTRNENFENASKILKLKLKNGKLIEKLKGVEHSRNNFKLNFKKLPCQYKEIDSKSNFPVTISENLNLLQL